MRSVGGGAIRKRAYASRVLFTVLIAGLLSSGASAQSSSVRDLWPQSTAAAEGGDLDAADARLAELIATGRASGIARFPVYAESAIALARQAQREGNDELTQWGIRAASRLDPFSPEASLGVAALARDRGDWAEVITGTLRATRKAANVYSARVKAQMDLLIVAATTIGVVTAIFALVLLSRHHARAIHDLSETLATKIPVPFALALAWALLFLPLFLTLGPAWLIAWWLALFFGYASRKEQIAAVILLLLSAAAPLMVEWAAWRTAGLTSPVIRAAAASAQKSYRPASLRRLRELAEIFGSDPRLQALLGSLEAQEGNESRAAAHLKRAIEADPGFAGAHLNLGNLHFLNNDFAAAFSEYNMAAQSDPTMTIAFYNQSVAAGELYRFDIQGQKLEEAKRVNRALVDRLLASPPPQKIVSWYLPMNDAWQLHDAIARSPQSREFFGSYATFDSQRAATNPVTAGALLALVLGPLLGWVLGRGGLAGRCVKCGRTFCSRCKSSRESATYCTQCIHIYLKRDGVSLETKRNKLEEAQQWMRRTNRTRRLVGTLLPGAGQMIDGALILGLLGASIFVAAVAIAFFAGRLAPIATPSDPLPLVLRAAGIIVAVIAWLALAIPTWRTRAAQV